MNSGHKKLLPLAKGKIDIAFKVFNKMTQTGYSTSSYDVPDVVSFCVMVQDLNN
ncbi:hypothetical protein C5167_040810 [Papaver somniferum]|uniref:Pentacotripeptide-repeat region of PRORP domain-containing protein n=1 Tax=Papaver somniferum TaxID=3469 RepID=A0A4Y7IK70_PAPSO|nr:hypothetical protein C5167_040810 [Papaver somniferum]